MGESSTRHLTHVSESGSAHMVDVTDKAVTQRDAEARGRVRMELDTLRMIADNLSRKGDVLGVARIAGIQAAKRTADLIPLCHTLPLSRVDLDIRIDESNSCVDIRARVGVEGKTGVEMEALTAVSVAALTIYDMCKAVDRSMVIDEIRVTFKAGGRSGVFQQD